MVIGMYLGQDLNVVLQWVTEMGLGSTVLLRTPMDDRRVWVNLQRTAPNLLQVEVEHNGRSADVVGPYPATPETAYIAIGTAYGRLFPVDPA